MITAKINVTKIDKDRLYKGKSGTYLDCAFIPHKDGRDQYENDGFIVENLSKEQRDEGQRGNIIGYWRAVERKKDGGSSTPAQASKPAPREEKKDGLPF